MHENHNSFLPDNNTLVKHASFCGSMVSMCTYDCACLLKQCVNNDQDIIYSNVHNHYSMRYIQIARESIDLAVLKRQVNIPSLPLDSLSPVSNS